MIKYSFRILVLVLLFIIVLVQDIPYPKLFKSPAVQLYLAILAMLILVMVDNVAGFVLGVCLLVLYFKIYNKELKTKKVNQMTPEEINGKSEQKCPVDKPCNMKNILENYDTSDKANTTKTTNTKQIMQIPYVTDENLLAAQNNIVNTECYNNEVLGIEKGLYNENVYGPQGLDKQHSHIRGFDTQNALLGTMHYDIL
jgi:energy-coupling factor transporter transmembrane protein EcfT